GSEPVVEVVGADLARPDRIVASRCEGAEAVGGKLRAALEEGRAKPLAPLRGVLDLDARRPELSQRRPAVDAQLRRGILDLLLQDDEHAPLRVVAEDQPLLSTLRSVLRR